VSSFQEVLRLRPETTVALIHLANLSLKRGDAAAATEFAGNAIKNQPQLGAAHMILAKALLRQRNFSGAERQVLGLVKANPRSAEARHLLGEVYFAKGDTHRARESFEQELEMDPTSVPAIIGLTRIDLTQRNAKSAVSRIDRALEKTPDREPLLMLAADTFLTIGDARRAESTYQHVLKVNASNPMAYSRLGYLYGSQNRLDEALKQFEDMARRDPKATGVATMIGTILGLQNKPNEARKQYERALALDPKNPVAANNLAWDYAETGQNLDVALNLAQTAKARVPDSASATDTLGWVYYKKGLASLAVTTLAEASEKAPSDPSIRYRLGLAYLKNGDQKRARASLEGALKLNPEFKEAADAKIVLATLKG
jgi:tetratricopeptide (TPR) repeat protein